MLDMVIQSTMPTQMKLKEFLEERDISVYRLAQETEGSLSRTSLYSLTSQTSPPKGILFESLDTLIPALRELTGEEVNIEDLLEYVE